MKSTVKSIPAGEFKAKCLALLDEVDVKGRTFVVTKRGRPVARVVPLGRRDPMRAPLAGSVLREGDLLSPIDVEWNAEKS